MDDCFGREMWKLMLSWRDRRSQMMIWRRRHRRQNVEVTVLSTSDLGELLMLPLFEACCEFDDSSARDKGSQQRTVDKRQVMPLVPATNDQIGLHRTIFALYWSKNEVTVNYEDLTHIAELSESAHLDVSKSQYRRRV